MNEFILSHMKTFVENIHPSHTVVLENALDFFGPFEVPKKIRMECTNCAGLVVGTVLPWDLNNDSKLESRCSGGRIFSELHKL